VEAVHGEYAAMRDGAWWIDGWFGSITPSQLRVVRSEGVALPRMRFYSRSDALRRNEKKQDIDFPSQTLYIELTMTLL
jgi:hypothetical protein